LEELIVSRINLFTKNLAHTDMTSISEDTKAYSLISKDFLTKKKYDIMDERTDISYLIKRFWTIGFADPYPDDD